MIDLKNGDCLVEMGKIKDKSVDLILCDLPFAMTDAEWDILIPFDKLWVQYNRIIKDNGAICLFGIEPFSSKLRMSNLGSYRYDWTWVKTTPTNFLNCKKQPMRQSECISVFYKNQCTYNPQNLIEIQNPNLIKALHKGDRTNSGDIYHHYNRDYIKKFENYPRNILCFSKDSHSHALHPSQKPVDLLKYLIKTYTDEGQVVLDNCMGSGSTGVACIETNRNFIGIEKDEKYFDIASDRIHEAELKSKMGFRYTKETEVPETVVGTEKVD